nr:putative exosome complex component rrp40 [Ipomoea batatas]
MCCSLSYLPSCPDPERPPSHLDCDTVSVMKAGILRYSKPNKYWVESSQKRYVPCAGDSVLGIVVDTKPDAGTLIYARVVKANTGMNPELSCMDGKAAEFGPLKEGYMFESSTGLSRIFANSFLYPFLRLLSSPTCPVLEALGKKLSLLRLQLVNAPSPATTILVSNAIMNSESLSAVQQKIMVEKLLQRVQ